MDVSDKKNHWVDLYFIKRNEHYFYGGYAPEIESSATQNIRITGSVSHLVRLVYLRRELTYLSYVFFESASSSN